ncbi:DNA/RNA non-specific endonuclease, partial [Sphingomonas oligophenolica]
EHGSLLSGNCAPPGSALSGNQHYILDSARTKGFQACVFTGPVLRGPDDDPVEPDLAPGEELVIDGATVPMEFWKLVVTRNENGSDIHATAYLLSQGELIRKLLDKRSERESLEGFVLGEYRTFQLKIADLASVTEYDFSHYASKDPLARISADEGLDDQQPIVLPLESLADIKL